MSRTVKKLRNAKATATSLAELDVESVFDVSNVGWNNLETKYNELTALLSAPTAGLNANQARMQQKKAVSQAITKLLDMAQQECRRLLIEGNAKAAVEGGLKTLKLKELYYGQGSLQLVPAYFHLARTNQYMDRFKPAEEFLSLAQWTILKHPETDVSLKAELHQTFGLLYASDGKLDAALQQLTSATYYLCTMNGPEHILTSFGYFDLGNVFAASSNMENAMAFYDKVKDIWYSHLSKALTLVHEMATGEEPEETEESAMQYATPASFGEENLQDAVKMLRGIVGLQCERYGRVHPSSGHAEQVMGMFFLWNGDSVSALDSLLRALEIFKRLYGDRHPLAAEVRSLLLQHGMEVPDDTSHVLQIAPIAAEEEEEEAPAPPQEEDVAPPVEPQPPQEVDAAPPQEELPTATDDALPEAPAATEESAAEATPVAGEAETSKGASPVQEGTPAEASPPENTSPSPVEGAELAANAGDAAAEPTTPQSPTSDATPTGDTAVTPTDNTTIPTGDAAAVPAGDAAATPTPVGAEDAVVEGAIAEAEPQEEAAAAAAPAEEVPPEAPTPSEAQPPTADEERAEREEELNERLEN
jgi:hypothetical protein